MRYFITIFLFVLVLKTSAQNNSYDAVSPAFFKNGGVRLFSEAGINSNTFTGSFYGGLLDGRTYSNQTMSRITNRAGMENRAGSDSHTGFNLGIKLNNKKNDDLLLTIGAGFKTHFNASYSREALDVFLNGNSAYRGREANFDNFNATYLEYSQLKVGFHKQTSGGKRFGVTVALNTGRSMFTLEMPFARMYTHSNGSALRFNLLADAHYTEEPDADATAVNGIGGGLDFYYELPLNLSNNHEKSGFLRFAVHDLGFITFDQNMQSSSIDTLYFYRGTDIGTFPQQNSESIEALKPNEARDLISENAENTTRTIVLPFWFRVRAYQEFDKFDLTAGADYRVNANFTPYIYTHVRKYLAESWKIGMIAGAGGYGTGNFGFSFSYERNGWSAGVISQNLEGVLFSNNAGGVHGGIQLQKAF